MTKIAIVGDAGRRHEITEILHKLKGEIEIMEDNKILRPHTVNTVMDDWKELLAKVGQKAFWPSWLQGTYISKKNPTAMQNVARVAERNKGNRPDVKEKVILRHGKLVRILYNRKTGERIPTKGMSTSTKAKLTASNKAKRRQSLYFGEKNSLDAITAMMGFPRNMRRTLCRALGMTWNKVEGSYLEAEAMIREG